LDLWTYIDMDFFSLVWGAPKFVILF